MEVESISVRVEVARPVEMPYEKENSTLYRLTNPSTEQAIPRNGTDRLS
jgi:hypothetical protein